MTLERGSPAESKNCEILLLPTADGRFDTKVTVRSLIKASQVPGAGADPGFQKGGWMADHIYWGVLEKMPWLKK